MDGSTRFRRIMKNQFIKRFKEQDIVECHDRQRPKCTWLIVEVECLICPTNSNIAFCLELKLSF